MRRVLTGDGHQAQYTEHSSPGESMSPAEGRTSSEGSGNVAAEAASPEVRADAFERQQMDQLNAAAAAARDPHRPERYATVAELEEQLTTRSYRRGAGRGFW